MYKKLKPGTYRVINKFGISVLYAICCEGWVEFYEYGTGKFVDQCNSTYAVFWFKFKKITLRR